MQFAIQNRLIVPLTIFQGNHAELKQALEWQNSKEGFYTLLPMRNRHTKEEYWDDVQLLIINYVASAKMLVDHSRIALSLRPIDQSLREEIERRKKAMSVSPVITMVHLLSDYFTHHFKFSLISHFDLNRSLGDKASRFTVSKESLVHYLEKKKTLALKAKQDISSLLVCEQYLAQCDQNVEIEELIEHYYLAINDFYVWLLTALRDE